MTEAIAVIYAIGFMVFGFLGVCRMIDKQEPDILLLTPVWPLMYIKYIWKSLT